MDRIAIGVVCLGGMVVLGSLLFAADGIAGLGLFLIFVGLLALVRSFPGEGG